MIVTPGGTAVVPEPEGTGKHKDKPMKGKKQEFPTSQAPTDLLL